MSGISFTTRNTCEDPSPAEPFTGTEPGNVEPPPACDFDSGELLCREPEFASSTSVHQLVKANDPARERLAAFMAMEVVCGSDTDAVVAGNSSWERADERGTDAFARTGVTPKRDVAFLEAAGLKGRVSNGTGTAEVFSASAQFGMETELQVTAARVEVGSAANHVAVSALNAEAHHGVYNADGSAGVNAGASANIVGAEAQVSFGGNSFTFGVAEGIGAELSLGVRDVDRDGNTEFCGRVGIGPVTAGVCLEPAGLVEVFR